MSLDHQASAFTNQDLSNQLWWLAAQSVVPPTSLGFSEQQPWNGLGITPPPEILSKYHQSLLSHHNVDMSFDFNTDLFTQYPSNVIPNHQPDLGIDLFPLLKPLEVTNDALPEYDSLLSSPTSFESPSVTVESYQSSRSSSPSEFSEEEQKPKRRSTHSRRKSSTGNSRRKSTISTRSSSSTNNIDRIRERNRISAQRFRDKKKADTSDLEMKTDELARKREELVKEITELQWQSILLQEQCLRSTMCNCEDVRGFFKNNSSQHGNLCVSENQTD